MRNFLRTSIFIVLLFTPAIGWTVTASHDIWSKPVNTSLQDRMYVWKPMTRFDGRQLDDFKTRYNQQVTFVKWNVFTGTPHRILTEGLPISNQDSLNADSIESICRDFILANESFLKAREPELKLDTAIHKRGKWIVIFQQYYEGLYVEGGRVDLRITDEGKLPLLGSDFFNGISLNTEPTVSLDEAFTEVANTYNFNPDTDAFENSELVILPKLENYRYVYHLAWRINLLQADPLGNWYYWVDANTLEILDRDNVLSSLAVTGDVWGDIHVVTGRDPMQSQPMQNMTIKADNSGSTMTDFNGDYNLALSGSMQRTLRAQLKGPWADANNKNGSDAELTQDVTPGTTDANFRFNNANSTPAERDGFFWTTFSHNWIKIVDPTCTLMDGVMPVNVSMAGTCNAYFDGRSINFYRAGGGCGDMATFNDVVIHEYGHGVSGAQYGYPYPPGDMGEGFSDCHANTILDRPEIGLGVMGVGRSLRTSDNNRSWPASECNGEVHCVGEVLAGALWHTRENLIQAFGPGYKNQAVAYFDQLFFFAKYAKARSMSDYLIDFLQEDDDDGNLSNGTPYYNDICPAFERHNLDCPTIINGVIITHTALPSTDDTINDYRVEANITSNAGNIVVSSPKVFYSLNGGPLTAAAMAPAVVNNVYFANIPAQPLGTEIDYYITATDDQGNTSTSPENAPTSMHHFSIAQFIFFDDFEGDDNGWTHRQVRTQDDWHHDEPSGAYASDPGTAFSGTKIWGNDLGGQRGSSYWDGQYKPRVENYLESPEINCSGYQNIFLQYRRWLTVEESQYDQATIEVNGQEIWKNAYSGHLMDTQWEMHELDISQYADNVASVKITFRLKSDSGLQFGGWNIDDFAIIARGSAGPTRTPAPTQTPTPSTDTEPPYIDQLIPLPGDRGVVQRPFITFHLKDDFTGIDQSAFIMRVEDVNIQASMLGNPNDYLVTWFPQQDFALRQVINVQVEAADIEGNVMLPFVYSFTITDNPNVTPTPTPQASSPTSTPTRRPTATPTPSPTPDKPARPYMEAEPRYSKGYTNTVKWTPGDAQSVQYYCEIAMDSSFTQVMDDSEWIGDTQFTFTGLSDGYTYYYRVKAANSAYVESLWSNVAWSIQDASAPRILVGGYMNSDITMRDGGVLTMAAYLTATDVDSVELSYANQPLGIMLNDNGREGDMLAGDGLYMTAVDIPAGASAGQYLLGLIGRDTAGNEFYWPELVIPQERVNQPVQSYSAGLFQNELYELDSVALVSALMDSVVYREAATDAPEVMLGGFWDTDLSERQGGILKMLAMVTDPNGSDDISSVELMFAGTGTGVLLTDDGLNGDFSAGDGVYGFSMSFAPNDVPAAKYLFEIEARDMQGNASKRFPYLNIR